MGDIGGIVGGALQAAGTIAAAKINADAIKSIAKKQIEALEKQRKFVYDELDPDKLSAAALKADIARAHNRLALQKDTAPGLLALKGQAEQKISELVATLGAGSEAARVARQATEEAITGIKGMPTAKELLVDTAIKELQAGATLPPDVQAELVKAGLEKTGMVTGAASPKGIGGNLLRRVIGTEAIKLQGERQQRASGLLGQAQNLEQSRQQLLQTLFPNLSNMQTQQLAAAGGALQLSDQIAPEAGLKGTDIANLWLARVGATNQLAQSAADASARAGLAVAQAWQPAFGAGTQFISNQGSQLATKLSTPSGGGSFGGGGGNTFTGSSGTTYTADASGAFG